MRALWRAEMCSGVPTTRCAFCSDKAFAKLQLKRRTDVLELRARNTCAADRVAGRDREVTCKVGQSCSNHPNVDVFRTR
jgi:hypothetical protein